MTDISLRFTGITPPTHACAVCFVSFCAETKFEKGASDRNSLTGVTRISVRTRTRYKELYHAISQIIMVPVRHRPNAASGG